MPKIPKVQIPEKFKDDLYKRFDWELISKRRIFWELTISCPLCAEFTSCYDCPLGKPSCSDLIWDNFKISMDDQFRVKKEAIAYCKKITSILNRYVEWI